LLNRSMRLAAVLDERCCAAATAAAAEALKLGGQTLVVGAMALCGEEVVVMIEMVQGWRGNDGQGVVQR
jgi:hypothetical protein